MKLKIIALIPFINLFYFFLFSADLYELYENKNIFYTSLTLQFISITTLFVLLCW